MTEGVYRIIYDISISWGGVDVAFWLHLFFPFFAGSFGFCRWCCSHLSFWENYASGFSAGLSNKRLFFFFSLCFGFSNGVEAWAILDKIIS